MNALKRWLSVAVPAGLVLRRSLAIGIPVGALLLSILGGIWNVLGDVWKVSGDCAEVRATQAAQSEAIGAVNGRVDGLEERTRSTEINVAAMAENVRITRATVERIEQRMIGGEQ